MTTTENTGLATRQLTTQTTLDHIIDVFVQHLIADVVADFGGKSIHEQNPCVGLADATLTHIEHSFLVKLARGGTVRAFHIVGLNLQKRLTIDFCLRG